MEQLVETNTTDAVAEPAGRRHARSEGYYNILSYIVSNTISGELMAVDNYSEMVRLMPDGESRIATNAQAWEECKHILQLSKLARSLGFDVECRIVEPQWHTIRRHFSAAVKKGNLAACLIIQDIMTETMAIILYRTLESGADTDAQTASVARNILKDELEHLDIGVARIQRLIGQNSKSTHDALVWAHHRIMPELFSMISTSCHHLCDVLKLDCASLSLDEIKVDLSTLRVQALEQYIETLDRIGFEPKVVNPLIASMTAYEGMQDLNLSGDGQRCCSPAPAASGSSAGGKCC